MTPPPRPAPPPLEVDDWRLVGAGALLWAVALVALAVAALAGADIPGWWLWMCAFGLTLGLLGVRVMRGRARARQDGPTHHPTDT